ncbi:MAG: hypothetical protein OQL07_05080 [Gammaproteobacteria bacterium]|nr:hypothetical protein [Gammaproteobacteria bacterium]
MLNTKLQQFNGGLLQNINTIPLDGEPIGLLIGALLEKGPQTVDALAEAFKRKPTKALSQVLAALDVLGQAKEDDGLWHLI